MTDPKCDLPGGFVDDWKAGEVVCRIIWSTGGYNPQLIPGDGSEPTIVRLYPRAPRLLSTVDSTEVRKVCREALAGSGFTIKTRLFRAEGYIRVTVVAE